MKSFVSDIKKDKQFDLVIFDCPPILGLSDSLIISEYVDGVILTVSLNKVKRQFIKDSTQKFSGTSSNIIGTVANTVKEPDKELGTMNYYNYNYNYKYGYQNNYLPLETSLAYAKNEPDIKPEALKEDTYKSLKIRIIKNLINFKNALIDWLNE